METTRSQRRWRGKNRLVKSQLNVMARKEIHDALADIASRFGLQGKGEAVAFCCVLTRALIERAGDDAAMGRMIDDLAAGYRANRDVHAA